LALIFKQRELTPGHDFIGQGTRTGGAGTRLRHLQRGFNIFVLGDWRRQLESLRNWVVQQAGQESTPGDWVYVHNFAHPDDRERSRLTQARAAASNI